MHYYQPSNCSNRLLMSCASMPATSSNIIVKKLILDQNLRNEIVSDQFPATEEQRKVAFVLQILVSKMEARKGFKDAECTSQLCEIGQNGTFATLFNLTFQNVW